jgi:hypothetical protein
MTYAARMARAEYTRNQKAIRDGVVQGRASFQQESSTRTDLIHRFRKTVHLVGKPGLVATERTIANLVCFHFAPT